jgi:hypothetical protein
MLGLLNTPLALIGPYTGFGLAFGTYIMKGFFEGLPRELEEAARLDGAGEFRIFAWVMLLLTRPALATAAIFLFLQNWNEFLFALTFITEGRMRTLPTGIYALLSSDAPRYRHPRVGRPENSSMQPGGGSEAGATGDWSPPQPVRVISANAKTQRHTRGERAPELMPAKVLRLVEGAGFRPIRCRSKRSACATPAVWRARAGSARSRSIRAPHLMRLAVSRHR